MKGKELANRINNTAKAFGNAGLSIEQLKNVFSMNFDRQRREDRLKKRIKSRRKRKQIRQEWNRNKYWTPEQKHWRQNLNL